MVYREDRHWLARVRRALIKDFTVIADNNIYLVRSNSSNNLRNRKSYYRGFLVRPRILDCRSSLPGFPRPSPILLPSLLRLRLGLGGAWSVRRPNAASLQTKGVAFPGTNMPCPLIGHLWSHSLSSSRASFSLPFLFVLFITLDL